MNAGPYEPPPDQAPPPAETQEPAPYSPPPDSGAPQAAPQRRGRGPLVGIILVVVILIVAVLGYGVGGYVYANGRLNSAQDAYNKVVEHQNSLNDTVRSLDSQLSSVDVASATAATLDQNKTAEAQVATKSQAAQAEINTDDGALANAQASLKENQWLTVLRKPDLDKAATRIDHLRKALAEAKIITADYVQIATFFESLYDVAIDLDAVGTKAQATDIPGATAAVTKLKADTDKAISLDKAPGLPATMDTFLQVIKTLANDFDSLFSAVSAGNSAAAQRAETALQADVAKIQAIDYVKMTADIKAFYQPLLDAYNSEVDKANST